MYFVTTAWQMKSRLVPFIFGDGPVSSKHPSLGRSSWEFLIGLLEEKDVSFGNDLDKHSPTRLFLLSRFCPSFCAGVPASKPSVTSQQEQGPEIWDLSLINSESGSAADDSLDSEQDKPAQAAAQADSRAWGEPCQWDAEDMKVSGVHWGYEETKTFLAILSESPFSEKLRTCHQNRQVYRAIAERLRARGFLRTLEQCRYRVKNLLRNYRKAKNSHPPGTCPFYEELEALVRARTAIRRTTDGPGEAVALPRLGDSDTEMDDQDEGSWEPEETTDDCSGSGLATEESLQGPRIAGGPALLQSRIGKNMAFNWMNISQAAAS